MGFKRSALRAELDSLFDDAANNTWSLPQKNLAINYGIDALWPQLFVRKMQDDITLAASAYVYSSAKATDLTEMGFSIVELEVSGAPYRQLRDVFQRPDPSKTGGWVIEVGKTIVSGNVGKKLRFWYPARHPRLLADDAEIQIPASTPVVMYAALVLCTMFLPKRGHTELDAFVRLIPEWTNLWLKAKQENRTPPLPGLVPIAR